MSEERPAWVNEVILHFEKDYLVNGELIISFNSMGKPLRNVALTADLGDALPFLLFYKMYDYAENQIQIAKKRLWNGLYKRDGDVRLFLNHDWVLGLVELYRESKNPEYLELTLQSIKTLKKYFLVNGYLIDQLPRGNSLKTFLMPASPFNGGFIELWLEAAKFTKDAQLIADAEALARTWVNSSFFKKHGLFSHSFSVKIPFVNSIIHMFSNLKVRLFKDNTNLMWSMLDLYAVTQKDEWKHVIEKWIDAFEKYLWNNGAVFLYLSKGMKAHNVNLKAAFPSIDLLCDAHQLGIQQAKVTRLATSIADYWLNQMWEIGLFPDVRGAGKDHLDANTDMVVALAKLYSITGKTEYWQASQKCKSAILKYHHTPFGYVMAVNKKGDIVDDTILVKYQSLLLKLDLIKETPENIYNKPGLIDLLKDR